MKLFVIIFPLIFIFIIVAAESAYARKPPTDPNYLIKCNFHDSINVTIDIFSRDRERSILIRNSLGGQIILDEIIRPYEYTPNTGTQVHYIKKISNDAMLWMGGFDWVDEGSSGGTTYGNPTYVWFRNFPLTYGVPLYDVLIDDIFKGDKNTCGIALLHK